MKRKNLLSGISILFLLLAIMAFRWEKNTNFSFPFDFTSSNRCGGFSNFQLDVFPSMGVPLAPKLDGLGTLEFEVSTSSEEAQEFFNQGIRLVYAFNHAEAHRAFMEASRLDESFAMAYWGQALALGPNINDPLPDMTRQQAAFAAIHHAKDENERCTDLEKALINALEKRCTDVEMEQQELNDRYFAAMQTVYDQFSDHPDVGVLYAASIMNTMPWNYYDDNMNPRENTENCVSALKKVCSAYPDHPGGHHYFIHIIEAKDPDQAIPNADHLYTLMPKAGHIVHMPSHIYIVTGQYDKAVDVNEDAIIADEEYIAECQAEGMYPLAYYPHNLHFLWAASTMIGNQKKAVAAARKTAEKVPAEFAYDIPPIQDFMSVPLQAYVRFGKWNQILTTPKPMDNLLHANLIWHYSRGIAFCRKGQLEMAEKELQAVTKIAVDPDGEELYAAYACPTSLVAGVAQASLQGELAYARGNQEEAIEQMEKAVDLEMALPYQEPAAWHTPVRHYLGAALLETGQLDKAKSVYEADLKKNRNNGWALFGLYQTLVAQQKWEEAKEIKGQFEVAWKGADIALTSSRF